LITTKDSSGYGRRDVIGSGEWEVPPVSRRPIAFTVGVTTWAVLTVTACAQEEIPTAPPFNPPQLTPSLLDFLTGQPIATQCKLSKTPLLLQPPFAGAPIDTPKGLAADIKAKEVDVPNRIAAAQYLGTLDCVAFPEARKMLLAMALEDPFEPVRYEAVMALRIMLARGMDNPRRSAHAAGCGCEKCKEREKNIKKSVKETEKHAHHAKVMALCPKNPCELVHKTLPAIIHAPCVLAAKMKLRCQTHVKAEELRYDFCKGCCDAETLNALSKIANELDEQGCPIEPSPRVRQAAADALLLCDCTPVATPVVPVPAPPIPEKEEGEGSPLIDGEGVPVVPVEPVPDVPTVPEVPAVPETESLDNLDPNAFAQPRLLKTGATAGLNRAEAPPIAALRDYCVVALHDHRFAKANSEIFSIYKSRTFFFESEESKMRFDENPEAFAPVFCGMDPVCYVESQELREGRVLREHGGRFYLFVSEANWEAFQKNPSRYSTR
jgi:YHS domain-containing protein